MIHSWLSAPTEDHLEQAWLARSANCLTCMCTDCKYLTVNPITIKSNCKSICAVQWDKVCPSSKVLTDWAGPRIDRIQSEACMPEQRTCNWHVPAMRKRHVHSCAILPPHNRCAPGAVMHIFPYKSACYNVGLGLKLKIGENLALQVATIAHRHAYWCFSWLEQRRNGRHLSIKAGLIEEGHGDPGAARVCVGHPVQRRGVRAVGIHAHHVPDVAHKGARDGRCADPLTPRILHLRIGESVKLSVRLAALGGTV